MKMKPILFNTDMVRAIMDNRKTVTRRVVKPQLRMVYYDGELQDSGDNVRDGVPLWVLIAEGQNGALEQIVPPYQPGSILYVRETWAAWSKTYGAPPALYYKADGDAPDGIKWNPSIHMPRKAARIFLRVTDVRVERLQDIDDEGAKAEGVNWRNGKHIGFEEKMRCSAIDRFAEIWNSTIKPADRALYGWDANPWVWVVKFERTSKEEAVS